jgi:hypothetical protein
VWFLSCDCCISYPSHRNLSSYFRPLGRLVQGEGAYRNQVHYSTSELLIRPAYSSLLSSSHRLSTSTGPNPLGGAFISLSDGSSYQAWCRKWSQPAMRHEDVIAQFFTSLIFLDTGESVCAKFDAEDLARYLSLVGCGIKLCDGSRFVPLI